MKSIFVLLSSLLFSVNCVAVGSGSGGVGSSITTGLPTVDGSPGDVLTTNGFGVYSWEAPGGGGGSGDVVGPGSSNDFFVPLFDGVTGKLLKESFVRIETGDENTFMEFRAFDPGQNVGQSVDISAQDASANDEGGGNFSVSASAGNGTGPGGDMILNAGPSTDGDAGNVNINGANSVTGGGGSVNLKPGQGGSNDGAIKFYDNKVSNNQVARMTGGGLSILDDRYVRFTDNTFHVGFRGPTTYSSNIIWELPPADGAPGEVLQTDGAGVLSWLALPGEGANMALSNLAAVAINESLLPQTTATIHLGSAAKLWQDAFIRNIKRSTSEIIIDLENRILKDIDGNDVLNWENANETTFYNNLIPGSGSIRTLGKSGGPSMGSVWTDAIGTGSVSFTIPTVAATAGQVLTNNGSAVSSWGSGPITARAHASATTISGTLATVVWTTEDFDNRAALASGEFTCPEAGKYQVNASLAIAGTLVLNNTSIMQIQVDGTAISDVTNYIAGAVTNDQIAVSDIVDCPLNSVIRIQVSNSGTTPSIVSSDTKNWLSIARVGTL